jgi:hypothetical protein
VRYSFNRKNLKRFENHQGSNADSGRLWFSPQSDSSNQ